MSTFEKRRDEAARKWSEGWNPGVPWTDTTITKNFRQGADWARADLLKDIADVIKAAENISSHSQWCDAGPETCNCKNQDLVKALATWRERTGNEEQG